MPTLRDRLEKIPELLAERIERYGVPGASLAVLQDGETFETAAGVVNLDTAVETTPDAVFQIGSITKLFTTTLMMQLVDDGRVELEAPIRTYLPEFQLGNAEAARSITIRHLLTHTSGIDGDFFQDSGRGDDCVERYLLACAGLGQLHAPGELFSYCNAGFTIAGRIIEKLRGCTWDQALRGLSETIGAGSLHSHPEYLLFYRAAVGHVFGPDRGMQVAPVPFLDRGSGPAGATPFAAARDLLAFARMHIERGVAADGTRVLSEASVAAMQQERVTVPDAGVARAWGLGWMLFDSGSQRVIGHDGGTVGQNSYLRVVPERKIAVALLTNGGNTAALYRRIFGTVLGELADISLPPLPPDAELEISPERYTGTFERLSSRVRVDVRDGVLQMKQEERRPFFGDGQTIEAELHPVSESTFSWSAPDSGFRNYVTFIFGDDGRAGWLHAGGRSAPRVA